MPLKGSGVVIVKPRDAKLAGVIESGVVFGGASAKRSSLYLSVFFSAASGGIMDFMPLIVLVAVFYFLILRPQMKRAKEQKIMLGGLLKGDEVVTSGGILGRVSKVGEQYLSVEIADNVTVQVQKSTILTVLPKGTIKNRITIG